MIQAETRTNEHELTLFRTDFAALPAFLRSFYIVLREITLARLQLSYCYIYYRACNSGAAVIQYRHKNGDIRKMKAIGKTVAAALAALVALVPAACGDDRQTD